MTHTGHPFLLSAISPNAQQLRLIHIYLISISESIVYTLMPQNCTHLALNRNYLKKQDEESKAGYKKEPKN
jgi:hypothetical protein